MIDAPTMTTSPDNDRLITAQELAVRLGYKGATRGPRRVLAMAKAKVIPAVRLNARVIRFHWPTVLDALAPVPQPRRRMGRVG